jgi:hypothetical protein
VDGGGSAELGMRGYWGQGAGGTYSHRRRWGGGLTMRPRVTDDDEQHAVSKSEKESKTKPRQRGGPRSRLHDSQRRECLT